MIQSNPTKILEPYVHFQTTSKKPAKFRKEPLKTVGRFAQTAHAPGNVTK